MSFLLQKESTCHSYGVIFLLKGVALREKFICKESLFRAIRNPVLTIGFSLWRKRNRQLSENFLLFCELHVKSLTYHDLS